MTRQGKGEGGGGGGREGGEGAIRPTYCRTFPFRCESVERVWWEYGVIEFSWQRSSVLQETQLLAHVTQEIKHF